MNCSILELNEFFVLSMLNVIKKLFCSNEYYGGLWATFNFDGLQKWIEDLKSSKDNAKDTSEIDLQPNEKFLKASDQYSTVENIEETWYILK